MSIRIAGIVKESTVDGPGIRYVIFAQGCHHGCKGCQNPHTWDYNGGKDIEIEDILKDISKDPLIDGVSFSGGECFDQPKSFCELAKKIKEKYSFTIIAWSGYLYEELISDKDKKEMLEQIDYLVDGPFEIGKKDLLLKWRGSSNQRLIDVKASLRKNRVVEVEDIKR